MGKEMMEQKEFTFQVTESRNNKAGRFRAYMEHLKALARRKAERRGNERKAVYLS